MILLPIVILNPIYAKPFGHYSIGTSRSNFFRQVKMHDLLKIIYQRPIDEKISKKLFKQRLARYHAKNNRIGNQSQILKY